MIYGYRDNWEVYIVLPELKQTRQQLQNSLAELSYLKKHCETAVSECQQEKQVKIEERERAQEKRKEDLEKRDVVTFWNGLILDTIV